MRFKKIKQWFKNLSKKREAKLFPEASVLVEISESIITSKYSDGEILNASLDCLTRIEIQTNDSGPMGADVWFYFISDSGTCGYPQGATGDQKAIDYMFSLEGFNEDEFFKAMACTDNESFICWESIVKNQK